MPIPSVLDVMAEPQLFARWFQGPSWDAWRAFLAALFNLPRTEEQDLMCAIATGRSSFPEAAFREAWLCCGRRAGKSLIASFIAVYLSFFRSYAEHLAPGEQAVVMLCGGNMRQAKILLRYVDGFIREVPMLASMVVRRTVDVIELANGVSLEVLPTSDVRGRTCGAIINDEVAFWDTDENAALPDREILAAQRPSLVTIPNSLMLNLSSPYARDGVMFDAFEKYYGRDESPALFWKAPSRALPEDGELCEMNCSIPIEVVHAAYESDPIAASAEWGGNFRTDLERLFSLEAIEAITDYSRPLVLAPDFSEAAE
jgi:hypothetical protein